MSKFMSRATWARHSCIFTQLGYLKKKNSNILSLGRLDPEAQRMRQRPLRSQARSHQPYRAAAAAVHGAAMILAGLIATPHNSHPNQKSIFSCAACPCS
ncbi:MAG: hypothetical protein M0Z99_27015 [Betaproteobacteria bacterium]|nr:hypothetical protein [Betaproteobacteria bacterium]